MIREDRELLARLAKVNEGIARAVPELLDHQDGGVLPAAGLRALAEQLADVAERLSERADLIENVVEGPSLPAMGPGEDPGEDEGPTTICRRPPGAPPYGL